MCGFEKCIIKVQVFITKHKLNVLNGKRHFILYKHIVNKRTILRFAGCCLYIQ